VGNGAPPHAPLRVGMGCESTNIDVAVRNVAATFFGRQPEQLRAVAKSELKHMDVNHLSFLSHDLNNNLGAVSIHLEVLRRRLGRHGEFAEELSVLDQAQQSIDHTTRGMRRLLAHAHLRSKATGLHVQRVDLHDLTRGVATQHAAHARGKGLAIVVDVDPDAAVYSDSDLIAVVLQNLVGNAVKYSRRGATVTLVAREVKTIAGDRIVLKVSDEGPGIAPARLEHLFAPIRRGEPDAQDGMGLGLAIASEAARLLRGTLSVESEPEVGSTFSLQLPYHPDAEPAPAPDAKAN
jgi:signal transduction histidine kinase